jgi:hypothetical protein
MIIAAITARCPGCGAIIAEPARGRGGLIERADAGDPAAMAEVDGIRRAVLEAHRCPDAAAPIVAGLLEAR